MGPICTGPASRRSNYNKRDHACEIWHKSSDKRERHTTIETTQAREFYKEQLDYLFAKDVDGLIDNHYNEDATLVSFDFVVKGRDALKAHFRNYLKTLGHLEVKATNKFSATADTLFFEASVISDLGPAEVYDAMVLQNEKISYHFTGVK